MGREGVCGREVGNGLGGQASGTCLGARDRDTLTLQAPGLRSRGCVGSRAEGLRALEDSDVL